MCRMNVMVMTAENDCMLAIKIVSVCTNAMLGQISNQPASHMGPL